MRHRRPRNGIRIHFSGFEYFQVPVMTFNMATGVKEVKRLMLDGWKIKAIGWESCGLDLHLMP